MADRPVTPLTIVATVTALLFGLVAVSAVIAGGVLDRRARRHDQERGR
jgi:hypothetical protein